MEGRDRGETWAKVYRIWGCRGRSRRIRGGCDRGCSCNISFGWRLLADWTLKPKRTPCLHNMMYSLSNLWTKRWDDTISIRWLYNLYPSAVFRGEMRKNETQMQGQTYRLYTRLYPYPSCQSGVNLTWSKKLKSLNIVFIMAVTSCHHSQLAPSELNQQRVRCINF